MNQRAQILAFALAAWRIATVGARVDTHTARTWHLTPSRHPRREPLREPFEVRVVEHCDETEHPAKLAEVAMRRRHIAKERSETGAVLIAVEGEYRVAYGKKRGRMLPGHQTTEVVCSRIPPELY
jgi:hypothetical protein